MNEVRTRLGSAKTAFRRRHAGLLHAIQVLGRAVERLQRHLQEIARRIEDVESRLRRLEPSEGTGAPWVEALVLVLIAVFEWPVTYTAAEGFLFGPTLTDLVAVPLAVLPAVLGYLLAREAERRAQHEPEHAGLVLAGIAVYTLMTFLLRWSYFVESGTRYFLPDPVMAALLTALSLIGLAVAYVVGRRTDHSGAPGLNALREDLQGQETHTQGVLERQQAQLHLDEGEYGRLRHDEAERMHTELGNDFAGVTLPTVEQIEAFLDGKALPPDDGSPAPAAAAAGTGPAAPAGAAALDGVPTRALSVGKGN